MVSRRERWTARTDSPAFVALVAGLLTAIVLAALLIRDHGDASLVVHAGPPSTSATAAPPWLSVRPADQAYDGQFFYRLGVSPFSTAHVVSGVTFDVGALRNARWLSGALSWLLTAGHPRGVPWALLFINFVAAIALGAVAGALARSGGRHAAWGLLLVLYPGYAYTLTLDTSELLAGALVLAGIYAVRRDRWPLAAGLFAAAVLARDTTVAIPAGLATGGLYLVLKRRSNGFAPLLAGSAGVLVFAAWQALQRVRFHAWPFAQSRKANLSGPFAGFIRQIRTELPPHSGAQAFRLLSLAVLLFVMGMALWAIRDSGVSLPERVAWLPAAVVVVTLNAYLWSGATAFMRAGSESFLVSTLILLGHRARYAAWVALPVVGLWALSIGSQLGKG